MAMLVLQGYMVILVFKEALHLPPWCGAGGHAPAASSPRLRLQPVRVRIGTEP